ncbi:MAG: hypothetical protein PHU73_02590 [Patescibacteria group bacterium]|nr:hypothetical protein [Patescibacteria group bacterium]
MARFTSIFCHCEAGRNRLKQSIILGLLVWENIKDCFVAHSGSLLAMTSRKD